MAGPGLSVYREPALSNTAKAAKTTEGKVYSMHVENSNATKSYVHFYDVAAGSVTVGTTVPMRTMFVPATGGMDFAWTVPLDFDTAISCAATTTATGGTAPVAGLLVNVDYT